jgi:Hint domain-containing protein
MTFVINVTYDSSVTNLDNPNNAAYDPTLYTKYTSAVETAVQYYENEFTSPITVNINFGWGEAAGYPVGAGALGVSSTYSENYTYADVLAAVRATETTSLVQRTAVLTLPATDPTGGATFSIATAEARVLGLDATYNGTDGSVGLNSTDRFSWTQTNVASGTYDAVGTIEHEISEVLGRTDDAGIQNQYTLLDMFRYTAANGQSGDEPGSAVGQRDEPFVPGYSTTAAASAQAGLNSYSYFSYDGSTVTLQYDIPSRVAQGADVADWSGLIAGDSYGYGAPAIAGPVSTTDLEEMNVLGYDLACYLSDTQIATPSGEVPVQNLRAGDLVIVQRAGRQSEEKVKWVGNRCITLAGYPRPDRAAPICIRRDAMAPAQPNRDLRVSPDHCILIEDKLIPAVMLVNDMTIVQERGQVSLHYFHVELDRHGILLAEGLPTESYLDTGNRATFTNAGVAMLHPDFQVNGFLRTWKDDACAPLTVDPATLEPISRRLADRGRQLGFRPRQITTDSEPNLHVVVAGRIISPVSRSAGRYTFVLPRSTGQVILSSKATRPADIIRYLDDRRLLGVAVQTVTLHDGEEVSVFPADHMPAGSGWHDHESAAGALWRWTDGAGELLFDPLPSAAIMEVKLSGSASYIIEEIPACMAA